MAHQKCANKVGMICESKYTKSDLYIFLHYRYSSVKKYRDWVSDICGVGRISYVRLCKATLYRILGFNCVVN